MLGRYNLSEVAQEARVLEPSSPNWTASGMAPIPKESRTIRKMRFICCSFSKKAYLFSMATATSRATFIMAVKEVSRSSEVVSSPVSTSLEMVQMHRARLL